MVAAGSPTAIRACLRASAANYATLRGFSVMAQAPLRPTVKLRAEQEATMFKHIVVGCNGRAEGRDAVALGAAIADATGARLSLVGVFAPSLFPVVGVNDRKTLRSETTQILRRERNLLAPDAVIHAVADTSVARALRHYAERWQADLVIIGSDRCAAPGHAAISRRGRQLLYDAPFSLALAARGLHEHGVRLAALGVGYDGGPEAQEALSLAAELARSAHARLVVRHVVEDQLPGFTTAEWIAATELNHAHVWQSACRRAQAETEAATSELVVPAEVSATVGDPGYQMRALSEMTDLVVVGSRRWGPVARLVSGGVGETLVADASCSILIVPRPSSAARQRLARQRRQAKPVVA
jgi:nucleotide-binding universal stress UspA family protein